MLNNLGLFALRVSISAIMILTHGLPKLMNPGPFIENVTKMGLPLPGVMAYLAISAETLFPLLIIIGFYTRVSAFISGVNMLVAGFVIHMIVNGDPFLKMEMAVLYMIVFFFIVLAGPGSPTYKNIIGSR